jgi:hypothetical protein
METVKRMLSASPAALSSLFNLNYKAESNPSSTFQKSTPTHLSLHSLTNINIEV